MGICNSVPLGLIIDDIILYKDSIILNIRVRGDSCGSLRRNSTESSSSSTSDFSDSDDKTFVIYIDRRSFHFEVTTKLRPSEIFFSKTKIECDPYKLEKDIKRICTGKYRFGDDWIEVYEFDGKYCAINNELLWKLRVVEKFQECFRVKAKIAAIPKCTSYPYYSDELHLDSEMRRVFFKFRKTIQELPRHETLRVDPSEVLYSNASIPDKYDGDSIVSALAEFRKHPETLMVVRNEEKLYCLENRKLWLCKEASKLEKRLNKISVKVKMDIDTSMLKYFTTSDSLTVRIRRSYSFSDQTETFLDFLQKDDDHK